MNVCHFLTLLHLVPECDLVTFLADFNRISVSIPAKVYLERDALRQNASLTGYQSFLQFYHWPKHPGCLMDSSSTWEAFMASLNWPTLVSTPLIQGEASRYYLGSHSCPYSAQPTSLSASSPFYAPWCHSRQLFSVRAHSY